MVTPRADASFAEASQAMSAENGPALSDAEWSVAFDTVRREELFRNPPKDKSAYPLLQDAIRPHVDSFNAIFGAQRLVDESIKDIGTQTFLQPEPTLRQAVLEEASIGRRPIGNHLSVRIKDIQLEKPRVPDSNRHTVKNRLIYPAECRERHCSYKGRLRLKLEWCVDNGEWQETVRELGHLPIMLRTNRCHLENCSPAELVHHKEETEELGGYFITNGNEKLIRMLMLSKRNYPMAIIRGSFVNRGSAYSKFGIQIRSVRPDMTSQTNVLHYLSDGNVTFRFSWKKNEYLVPVMMILKALMETNDRQVFEGLVGGTKSKGVNNTFVTERVELLLRTYKAYRIHGKAVTRAYLGGKFKHVLNVPKDILDEDSGSEFLRKIVLVHLGNVNVADEQDGHKFDMLLFMIRKLYALVAGDCAEDNPDAVANQDVLLGGHLYNMIIKEKLEDYLLGIGAEFRKWSESLPTYTRITTKSFNKEFLSRVLRKVGNDKVGSSLEYFLSTGNLTSTSGLDLQQTSGFTIVAEKINFYRFLSHFRMIHRGSFFAQLKTTTVRKLLPESWGFLCPVHTPDGGPCGLLNHFAHRCNVMTSDLDVSHVRLLLVQMGINASASADVEESMAVQLDGQILGFCSPKQGHEIARSLRHWKVEGTHGVPLQLEIGYIPISNRGLFPGLYLFSQSARMVRPVKYLQLEKIDYVGPFEQPFMSIACREHEIEAGESTHVETDVKNILSIFANQTPFSDHNQSPRNMYQCQMAKQAMGTPGTSIRYRTDNKSYRLQTGQTPIVRPPLYNEYGLDNFPNGMNAVVAVISYTGYDMDDAMIINKSAHERGFGYGTMYKTKIIRLDDKNKRGGKHSIQSLFGFAPVNAIPEYWRNHLDGDGMPMVGMKVQEGDPLYCTYSVTWDPTSDRYVNRDGRSDVHKYKDAEMAYIEEVRVIGHENGDMPCQAISIKLRIPRSPVIGDKFSSRHGQKGVCSQKWPTIDMPFSESGIVPDVIINPHAFPSRMTIGMFVESLAGKAGALHGLAQDSSPWRFDDDNPSGDFFGEQLRAAGFNYHGNEPMYSGITGREFAADIYLGVVFYQRLRHMVNDKFQVRTTGPVTPLTGQPIKGRSRGGGIRVGEMERDALLAHGAAYLLQDRLLNCSDYCRTWICRKCGSFLSTQTTVVKGQRKGGRGSGIVRCRKCATRAEAHTPKALIWEDGDGIRYQGGDMGVKMKFNVGP